MISKMPRIYTRKGDTGKTHLLAGSVEKTNRNIKCIGQVDQLNAQIGWLYDLLQEKGCLSQDIEESLSLIQDTLFMIGAQLADPNHLIKMKRVSNEEVCYLENRIDAMTAKLQPLNNFILPRGHCCISACHLARTLCRKVEIACFKLEVEHEHLGSFLNRLSDYFFTLARYIGYTLNIDDVIWRMSK